MRLNETNSNFQSEHYIIGIGASAGGLEPIHEVFDNMPDDTNFSFVIIQHLSPDHKSLMSELLSKHTAMKVVEAEDKMEVQKNCVYLIPNNKIMTLHDNQLRLSEKDRHQVPNNAIDTFFESLALSKGKYAVGIILSGSGTDGSRGVEAIRRNGGIVIVQDPNTADFDSMPTTAIHAGADLVLAPEMIAEELIEYLKDAPYFKTFEKFTQENEGVLTEILSYVRGATQNDFSQYKRPTITRRLAKRMSEKGIRDIKEYLQYLKDQPDEATILTKEFLINVTRFFRDAEAFDEIKTKVIPSIFTGKKVNDTIKLWVVACSTGEEAYSLAILLQEYMDDIRNHDFNIKIFATDIDKDALQIASLGVYGEHIAQDISSDRLNRYFTKEGSQYRIVPSLRKMVVFAYHDITKDPPFSKLDLVSCRNLLIYMNPALQKQVLKTFLFAVNPGSTLILGASENIGVLKDSMKEVNKKWKIYKCMGKNKLVNDQILTPLSSTSVISNKNAPRPKNAFSHLDEIFKDTLLEEYRYAGILIDENMEVKHAIGRFKEFLTFPDNSFSFNLLKLVESDLAMALGMCVRKAQHDNEKNILKNVKVSGEKGTRTINIIVKPYLHQPDYQQSFLFIILQEEEYELKKIKRIPAKKIDLESSRIQDLENQLRDTKENLQTLIEELESANEELMTSNEEMISANEELQSTNEELQSLNEELHTVSAEHQVKIKELIELNDDLNNYFQNNEIGQILLDRNMIVRKFSPAVTKQINLIETDIGRPIADITNNLKEVNLIYYIKQVMLTNKGFKREVILEDDKIYLMKVNPYLRQDKSTDGVIINFIDITETKNLSSIVDGVFNSSTSGITAKRAIRNEQQEIIDFEYIAVNHSAEKIIGVKPESLIGKRIREEFKIQDDVFKKYVAVVETGQDNHFEYRNAANGKWYEVVAVKMRDGLVTTFTDVTQKKSAADIIARSYEDLKEASNKLIDTNNKLEQSNMDLLQFASVASHDLKEPLRKIQTFGNFLAAKIEQKLEPSEKSYLDKIIHSSHRMQILIEDVLTLSKLSNKDIPFVKTDLTNVVKRIVEDLEITIQERKSEISIEPLPTIEAVPGQMRQLFQNLISNALKFNQGNAPIVSIRQRDVTHQEAIENSITQEDYVAICVTDNGIGFDDQFKEKIFGIFQRLNPTQFQGTGIGLAICKKIIDNHNGFIRAESKIGHGSNFILLLPKEHKAHTEIQDWIPEDDQLIADYNTNNK